MSPIIGFASNLGEHPKLPDIFCYVWLEGLMEAKLARLRDAPSWNDLKRWPAGRLFGEKGEYRWQARPKKRTHSVILLDEGKLPEGFVGELELEPAQKSVSHLILWGEWVDPKLDKAGNPDAGPLFYSRQIPDIQEYPIEPDATSREGTSPRLVIRRYHHKSDNSQGEFLRCAGLGMQGEASQAARQEI